MFPHGPWQQLVFIISVMLIMKYCSVTFGQRLPTSILQSQNRLFARYDAATFRANFRFQKRHKKPVMLCLGMDADIIRENRSIGNSEEAFPILF